MMDAVLRTIRGAQRIMVTGHLQPDGDAIGSMLALGHLLGPKGLGKDLVLYNPDEIPMRYRFLPGTEAIVRALGPGARFDATIVVDCGDEKLLGPTWPGRDVTGTVVVLDHHRSHRDFGDVVYRSDACAVGEIVFRIAERLGVPVGRDAAECIYASMCTDTGGFRYASTTPDSLRIAAALVEAGAQPWKAAWHLFEAWPIARLRLLTDVLAGLELRAGGRIALLRVPRETVQRHGASADMIEGFINYARMVDGVEVSALVSESDQGIVRASFRSRGKIPVDSVAARFGGGGHLAAAGCSFEGTTLETALGRIAAALEEAVAAAPERDDFWSHH